MALPQRQEPDDQWGREYDEAQSRRVSNEAQNQRVSDDPQHRFENDLGRRNDLLVRRRRSGLGWLWLIVAALFLWWAISHAHHNRMIRPGTNNNPAITGPNNVQPNPNNVQPNQGPNAPNGGPAPNNNPPAPQQ